MTRFSKRSLLALLLALAIFVTLIGCDSRDPSGQESEPSSSEEAPAGSGAPGFANPLPVPDGPGQLPTELTAYSERAAQKDEQNADTAAWLNVPGTSVDDVVMFYADDPNEFYLRKNFDKNYSWEGSYFADFRTKWGDGTRDGLSQNIVIYGHSMEDDPNAPLFSQLKKYHDEDFAKQNPYMYFSTPEEDMVWEVFAVYYTTVHELYNTPDFETPEAYQAILTNAQESSLYTYEDLELTPEDKILTLSTCCYNITSVYPNDYRYVVMAKLVEKNATLKEEASLTVNPNPKMPG